MSDGHVIAMTASRRVEPIVFVHGKREVAKELAAQVESWYVLGGVTYKDGRDTDGK